MITTDSANVILGFGMFTLTLVIVVIMIVEISKKSNHPIAMSGCAG
ncbi:putative holin-like toxin [Alkalicoccobacillus porphyridii]|nr:putative holin-like toxin [Alkalicoccobacillus porphyridii]